MPIRLAASLPFEKAIEAAAARRAVLPDYYYNVLQKQSRSDAFTITGMWGVDQIQTVMDSLTVATAEGQTFAQWKEAVSESQFAHPNHRKELIFRNSIQTSYSQGRWHQLQEAKGSRQILMWDAINDGRTRPAHRKMSGYMAPVDDPIWNKWSPPAGHHCRCALRSLTLRQAKRRGYVEGEVIPPPSQPDAGWDYNKAGDLWKYDEILWQKLSHAVQTHRSDALREAVEQIVYADQKREAFAAWVDQVVTAGVVSPVILPVGLVSADQFTTMASLGQPMPSPVVGVSSDVLEAAIAADASPVQLATLPTVIKDPDSVLWDAGRQVLSYQRDGLTVELTAPWTITGGVVLVDRVWVADS